VPALEIAQDQPDQVACLVLVSEASAPAARANVPVLVVDGTEPADTIGERVRDFLARGAPATA
jgi:hypothetical protein